MAKNTSIYITVSKTTPNPESVIFIPPLISPNSDVYSDLNLTCFLKPAGHYFRIQKRSMLKIVPDVLFWVCVEKVHPCWWNGIILCHCITSNGILYSFEGRAASHAGKWKNCNTFLSFCLAILRQWFAANSRSTTLEDQKALW